MEWNKSSIRHLLQTNDRAVERAVLVLYRLQTNDEQHTRHNNSVGFSACDASLGSYYARWLLAGKSLTGKHLDKARGMMQKYCGQLVQVVAHKEP